MIINNSFFLYLSPIDWFQVVRAFMLLSILLVLIAFAYGIKATYSIPVMKNKNARAPNMSLALSAMLMFLAGMGFAGSNLIA